MLKRTATPLCFALSKKTLCSVGLLSLLSLAGCGGGGAYIENSGSGGRGVPFQILSITPPIPADDVDTTDTGDLDVSFLDCCMMHDPVDG